MTHKTNNPKWLYTAINIPKKTAHTIDAIIEKYPWLYKNRTEFVKEALRTRLVFLYKHGIEQPKQ